MTVIVSEPLKELINGSGNAKHVKHCTELFLGCRGIERLAGFERLLNLEVLWVNGNRLQAISGLDTNIKELYAQDNQLCTLKGSLQSLKFLQQLDLSGNALRDLAKVLRVLERLRFMRTLNLKDNPCCEEPDYRLLVVHTLPWVQVLDLHSVTNDERRAAAKLIGGDVAARTVAFGTRIPRVSKLQECVGERSPLELDLAQEAAAVRQKLAQQEEEKERQLYADNPWATFYSRQCTSLPPPPGWVCVDAGLRMGLTQQQQQRRRLSLQLEDIGGGSGAGIGGAWGAATHAWQQQGPSVSGGGACTGGSGWSAADTSKAAWRQQQQQQQQQQHGYVAKDIVRLHGWRMRAQQQGHSQEELPHASHVAAAPGSGPRTTGFNTGCSFAQGTFRHHMTPSRWEVVQTAPIKL